MDEDPATLLVQQLRALAAPGQPPGDRFVVRYAGYAFAVDYTSGSSASLVLDARYDDVARADHPALLAGAQAQGYRQRATTALVAARPLAIELRLETRTDARAKREGLSAEWQSGDEAFDRVVYVSTPADDPALLAAVLGAEVRRGVLALLDLGFRTVKLDDDGRVRADLIEFVRARLAAPATRGQDTARAFAQILANLPAVTASGAAVAPVPLAGWTRALAIIGITGWALNVGYAMVLIVALQAATHDTDDRMMSADGIVGAIALALFAGVLGARSYRGLVGARVRGTSRAHERAAAAGFAAFGGISVIAFTLAMIAFALCTAWT